MIKIIRGLLRRLANKTAVDKWESIKIADDLFIEKISKATIDKWNKERRKKDKLVNFIDKNGIYIKSQGRSGTIYYIENRKVCEIGYEISGVPQYDILIHLNSVERWSLPIEDILTAEEKNTIEMKLRRYIEENRIRAEF